MRCVSILISVVILGGGMAGCGGESPKFNNVAANLTTAKDGAAKSDGGERRSAETPADSPFVDAMKPDLAEAKSAAKDAAPKGGPSKSLPAIPGGAVPADPAPAATPVAIADPVAGAGLAKKKKQAPGQPAGILTAGSFDDNLDPRWFLTFLKRPNLHSGLQDIPKKLAGQRLLIQVKDAAGKPVGGAKVQLVAATGEAAELVTRTDGRTVFLTTFDNLPSKTVLTVTVTPPDGGAATTDKIDAGAVRWDISLPATTAKLPRNLDLAIVLDTTGSMGDEIDFLIGEMRGISKAIHDRFPEVQQRFALVVYRDEGDEYVAKHFDFASLDIFHKHLSFQRAGGGGDYPEAVHRGFEEANQLRWRSSEDTARVMFWVADAPPHAQHMNRTMAAANQIRKQGIAMYPIACSGYDDACEAVMRSCALLTGGQFLFLTDDSGVGGSHAEPKIPYYQVEHLEKLMIRMLASELSGQRLEANPADVIRTVGKKVN